MPTPTRSSSIVDAQSRVPGEMTTRPLTLTGGNVPGVGFCRICRSLSDSLFFESRSGCLSHWPASTASDQVLGHGHLHPNYGRHDRPENPHSACANPPMQRFLSADHHESTGGCRREHRFHVRGLVTSSERY